MRNRNDRSLAESEVARGVTPRGAFPSGVAASAGSWMVLLSVALLPLMAGCGESPAPPPEAKEQDVDVIQSQMDNIQTGDPVDPESLAPANETPAAEAPAAETPAEAASAEETPPAEEGPPPPPPTEIE